MKDKCVFKQCKHIRQVLSYQSKLVSLLKNCDHGDVWVMVKFYIKGAIKLTPRTTRFLSLVGNLNKQFNIKNILKKGKKHRKLRVLCLKRSNPQQWPWLQYLRAVWSGVIRCPYLNRCETFTASVLIQLSQRDKTH